MKRVAEVVAGTALLVGLAGTGSCTADTEAAPPQTTTTTPAEQRPGAYPELGTPSDELVVANAAVNAIAYWAGKGAVSVADTRVEIITGDETFQCPRQDMEGQFASFASGDEAGYCSTANTIVMTAHTINNIRYSFPNHPEAGLEFVVNHEYGHAAQNWSTPGIFWRPMTEARGRALELAANCLAGRVLAVTNPTIVEQVASELRGVDVVESADSHGDGEAQAAALVKGANGDGCIVAQ